MRNPVALGYFSVDLEIVWKTVHQDLPELATQIGTILDDAQKNLSTSHFREKYCAPGPFNLKFLLRKIPGEARQYWFSGHSINVEDQYNCEHDLFCFPSATRRHRRELSAYPWPKPHEPRRDSSRAHRALDPEPTRTMLSTVLNSPRAIAVNDHARLRAFARDARLEQGASIPTRPANCQSPRAPPPAEGAQRGTYV